MRMCVYYEPGVFDFTGAVVGFTFALQKTRWSLSFRIITTQNFQDWRDGSVVRRTHCASWGPSLILRAPGSRLTTTVMSVPSDEKRNSPAPGRLLPSLDLQCGSLRVHGTMFSYVLAAVCFLLQFGSAVSLVSGNPLHLWSCNASAHPYCCIIVPFSTGKAHPQFILAIPWE